MAAILSRGQCVEKRYIQSIHKRANGTLYALVDLMIWYSIIWFYQLPQYHASWLQIHVLSSTYGNVPIRFLWKRIP